MGVGIGCLAGGSACYGSVRGCWEEAGLMVFRLWWCWLLVITVSERSRFRVAEMKVVSVEGPGLVISAEVLW